jgi:hypothetical protein
MTTQNQNQHVEKNAKPSTASRDAAATTAIPASKRELTDAEIASVAGGFNPVDGHR